MQVQLALMYASKVAYGGLKRLRKWDRLVHAIMKMLSVSQKTSNRMIFGELGRHPPNINT